MYIKRTSKWSDVINGISFVMKMWNPKTELYLILKVYRGREPKVILPLMRTLTLLHTPINILVDVIHQPSVNNHLTTRYIIAKHLLVHDTSRFNSWSFLINCGQGGWRFKVGLLQCDCHARQMCLSVDLCRSSTSTCLARLKNRLET